MNAHHKQLFFSDSPVFVEGIFDAWIVQGLMESSGCFCAWGGELHFH